MRLDPEKDKAIKEYKFNPKVQKLKQMQSLTLEQKIIMSKMRIRQWHEHYEGNVVVSFSGGGRQYCFIAFSP